MPYELHPLISSFLDSRKGNKHVTPVFTIIIERLFYTVETSTLLMMNTRIKMMNVNNLQDFLYSIHNQPYIRLIYRDY